MIFILDKNGLIKEVNPLGAKELGYKSMNYSTACYKSFPREGLENSK